MMRSIALWLALFAMACATDLSAQSAPEPQPSVELPSDLERVLRDYERHWSAGESDDLAGLFVERGLIVRQGTWIRGRDAIRRAYEGVSGPLQLRAVEYATSDSLGYIVGAYGYGESLPVDDIGLFVLTLRLGDEGRWMIVSDMDRSGD
jgi:hypothetical protein